MGQVADKAEGLPARECQRVSPRSGGGGILESGRHTGPWIGISGGRGREEL